MSPLQAPITLHIDSQTALSHQSDADAVVLYIQNQEQHHRKMTFQEEYRKFLLRYRVAYEERYVWD